ncbi:MAG TPA: 2-amino-4-hydroxy-6-hydroxymethyldihydropteridine diphosphokinase [Vicinamibacterales bacterium]|jgi:2-amino-4-hydroxy-6-hydroxymethyldihydropteridine diphosphokinase
MTPVAIALGSNLGDREQHLHDALTALAPIVHNLRVSTFHDTAPVGVPGPQPMFLNAAAVGETTLSANAMLEQLLAIEASLGRVRPYPNAPRTIDLDLILYDAAIEESARLTLPHARFRERRFVLEPLAEIAPDWRDPVTGKSVEELLRALST